MSRLHRVLNIRNAWSQPPFWANPDPTIWTSVSPDTIADNFESYVRDAYRADGIVFACMLARQLVISEARFVWQSRAVNGRPSGLFVDNQLRLLDRPWANGTTGHLLARMDQHDVLVGNYFGVIVGEGAGRRIQTLRPDWMRIIVGSPDDDANHPEARPVAYAYQPRRRGSSMLYTPDQIIHYYSIPDPEVNWRGQSYLRPILDEVKGDRAATKHKLKFFENGAVPGLVLVYPSDVPAEKVKEYARFYRESKEGVDHAYKTLHVGGGADPKTVGANLQQLDFKVTQGASETRIAAALRVHPVIVGLSEGMQGSSLNAGNFMSARRLFADGTIRPLWRQAAAALESVLTIPDGADRLWYDDRDVAFLRDDAKDEAETRRMAAVTIRTLIDAGFEAATVVEAVSTGDWSVLRHTGLFSVQLQRPGTSDSQNRVTVTSQSALTRLIGEGWTIRTEEHAE